MRSPSTLRCSVPDSTRCAFARLTSLGRTYQSAARTVNVPTPAVTITSPSASANLPSGSVSVTYAPSPWDWYWVDLLVDGSPSASASPGDPLTIDTTWFEPGPHTLVVRASDEYGRAYDSPPVAVTFESP